MPTVELIDPALVARFAADLERLTGEPPTAKRPLGVAVSGGADSLGLLLLANAAYPAAVAAATVDHGLRPGSADEARYVTGLCAYLSVPHATLEGAFVRTMAHPNLQERARVARYAALETWACAGQVHFVATAHHREDVAESFLMRAARGGGVRSLAAMPATRLLGATSVLLVRPLLGWTRAALAAIVDAAGITPVVDPSNSDPRYDRARFRRLLTDHPDLAPEALARAASNLRDVEEAIEWVMLREVRTRFEEDAAGGLQVDPTGLPFEMHRRLVLRAVQSVREANGLFDGWRPSGAQALVHALMAGEGGTLAEVQARALADGWHFRLAPPRRGSKG